MAILLDFQVFLPAVCIFAAGNVSERAVQVFEE
jgi:hypothetical protein